MLEIRLGVWALDHFQCTVACPRVHWATSFLPSIGVVLVGSLLQNFQNSYLVRKPLKERMYLEYSSRWTLPLDLWGFLSKLDLQFHENFYKHCFSRHILPTMCASLRYDHNTPSNGQCFPDVYVFQCVLSHCQAFHFIEWFVNVNHIKVIWICNPVPKVTYLLSQ